MNNQAEMQISIGQCIKRRRIELGKTQAEVASASGISASYFCAIESGTCVPPPSVKMTKILPALEFCETEAYELLQLTGIARGLAYGEADLPEEAQALIREIRLHAYDLPPRFLDVLRTHIREAID